MKIFDEKFEMERALYGCDGLYLQNCLFDGPTDGESALKECKNVSASSCTFALRYPLWHCEGVFLNNCQQTPTCRASLWYCKDVNLTNCKLHGVKALRECQRIYMDGCDVISAEFGWKCDGLTIANTAIDAQYLLFMSQNARLVNVNMRGKYSFQYLQNATVSDSILDTKDAFWHCNNVTVTNCVVKGEYLGWYSNNLTFVNCKITGTQPLCYCTNLKLINCTMEGCDLAFERSQVDANVVGKITSVKNPLNGVIVADEIGDIVWEKQGPTICKIITKN